MVLKVFEFHMESLLWKWTSEAIYKQLLLRRIRWICCNLDVFWASVHELYSIPLCIPFIDIQHIGRKEQNFSQKLITKKNLACAQKLGPLRGYEWKAFFSCISPSVSLNSARKLWKITQKRRLQECRLQERSLSRLSYDFVIIIFKSALKLFLALLIHDTRVSLTLGRHGTSLSYLCCRQLSKK